MGSNLIGGESEGEVRAEECGLAVFGLEVFGVDGDIYARTRFLLLVQKLEKRWGVSMRELGIIYF